MINPLEISLGNLAVVIPEQDGKHTKVKKGKPEMFLINGVFQENEQMFRVFGIGIDKDLEFDTTFDKVIPIKVADEILKDLGFTKKDDGFSMGDRANIKLMKTSNGCALFVATERRTGMLGFLCKIFGVPTEWCCLQANIKYVHDLQNIWYSLVGESLEVPRLRGKTFEQLEEEHQDRISKLQKESGELNGKPANNKL